MSDAKEEKKVVEAKQEKEKAAKIPCWAERPPSSEGLLRRRKSLPAALHPVTSTPLLSTQHSHPKYTISSEVLQAIKKQFTQLAASAEGVQDEKKDWRVAYGNETKDESKALIKAKVDKVIALFGIFKQIEPRRVTGPDEFFTECYPQLLQNVKLWSRDQIIDFFSIENIAAMREVQKVLVEVVAGCGQDVKEAIDVRDVVPYATDSKNFNFVDEGIYQDVMDEKPIGICTRLEQKVSLFFALIDRTRDKSVYNWWAKRITLGAVLLVIGLPCLGWFLLWIVGSSASAALGSVTGVFTAVATGTWWSVLAVTFAGIGLVVGVVAAIIWWNNRLNANERLIVAQTDRAQQLPVADAGENGWRVAYNVVWQAVYDNLIAYLAEAGHVKTDAFLNTIVLPRLEDVGKEDDNAVRTLTGALNPLEFKLTKEQLDRISNLDTYNSEIQRFVMHCKEYPIPQVPQDNIDAIITTFSEHRHARDKKLNEIIDHLCRLRLTDAQITRIDQADLSRVVIKRCKEITKIWAVSELARIENEADIPAKSLLDDLKNYDLSNDQLDVISSKNIAKANKKIQEFVAGRKKELANVEYKSGRRAVPQKNWFDGVIERHEDKYQSVYGDYIKPLLERVASRLVVWGIPLNELLIPALGSFSSDLQAIMFRLNTARRHVRHRSSQSRPELVRLTENTSRELDYNMAQIKFMPKVDEVKQEGDKGLKVESTSSGSAAAFHAVAAPSESNFAVTDMPTSAVYAAVSSALEVTVSSASAEDSSNGPPQQFETDTDVTTNATVRDANFLDTYFTIPEETDANASAVVPPSA